MLHACRLREQETVESSAVCFPGWMESVGLQEQTQDRAVAPGLQQLRPVMPAFLFVEGGPIGRHVRQVCHELFIVE